jgi:hypothetical protein
MGTYGHREGGIPGVEFPRNAFNTINAASGATGGGMGTNLYAGGVFELEPDEALVVENRIPREPRPQYIGFQLGNLWGESSDYANRLGSLNGHQSEVDPDGVIRLVVAHRDPGVPNWLDTAGCSEGLIQYRFIWSETNPQPVARTVPLAAIRSELPPDTPSVDPEARRETIGRRQDHVARREGPG